MDFRIADTFTDSLARLVGDEQRAAKTTAFDLQMNPANPGMKFHRLERGKDRNFWSVRVSKDIRLIVHKTEASLLLCYVDHHDGAYRWAERRKIERHPKTGAAQLVEIRERVQEITIPKYVEAETIAQAPSVLLFESMSNEELMGYGVPEEWTDDVRQADEDGLLKLFDHLPSEAGEALLEIATGGTPTVPTMTAPDSDPFVHPDAQRRFRVMTNADELRQALEYPWERWTVFLHPAQRDLVERGFNGPARVAGSAGTGKTIVALHRAVFLANQNPPATVLVTTFSEPLARLLRSKLRQLVGEDSDLLNRVNVSAINDVGIELYSAEFGEPDLASTETIKELLRTASQEGEDHRFSDHFLWTEWSEVVDAWQLQTWEAYRDVARLGRKTRLGEKQRKLLWAIFDRVRAELASQNLTTLPAVFARVTESLASKDAVPFEYAVVDEAQDISVSQLRFLSAMGASRPNGLFFAGDLGQRIFQSPFSWKSLGVDVRGRSHRLRINYRTSHQIRRQADRLLPRELSDVDGVTEDRKGTVSIFNGADPAIEIQADEAKEIECVSQWLIACTKEGIRAQEIGVFVRSEEHLDRAISAVEGGGMGSVVLDEKMEPQSELVSVSTMHLAKGLEFRAVVVMACDDEVIPLQERIASVVDDSDLEDVYNTERQLLYVACTRARDRLLITGVDPASEYLDDLLQR